MGNKRKLCVNPSKLAGLTHECVNVDIVCKLKKQT